MLRISEIPNPVSEYFIINTIIMCLDQLSCKKIPEEARKGFKNAFSLVSGGNFE